MLGYDCASKQAKLCLESPGVSSCAVGTIFGAALLEELPDGAGWCWVPTGHGHGVCMDMDMDISLFQPCWWLLAGSGLFMMPMAGEKTSLLRDS